MATVTPDDEVCPSLESASVDAIEAPVELLVPSSPKKKAPTSPPKKPPASPPKKASASPPQKAPASPKRKRTCVQVEENSKPPVHLLMRPASEHPLQQPTVHPILLSDRGMSRDYLSKRYRAQRGLSNQFVPLSQLIRTHTPNTSEVPLWSGATAVERAFVGCCELPPPPPPSFHKRRHPTVPTVTGGAVARGYEVRFAELLVKHAHNYKDRVLALAILERTLERDQKDTKEEEKEDEEEEETIEKPAVRNTELDGEKEVESDDGDGILNSNKRGNTKQNTRIQKKRWRPPKRAKREANLKPKPAKADKTPSEETGESTERLLVFFSAGGLKILTTWLVDAMTPVYLPMVRGETKTEPSQYGLMLLPLLHFLSKIPFDKNLIVESKINKQIRKLSKHVDELIEIFKKKNKSKQREELKAALEEYTNPGAGGCVVLRVQEILNRLKATWEEHAKSTPTNATRPKVKDPFESIKLRLKERLGELNDFKAGKIEKPLWLTHCEEARLEKERKEPPESLPSVIFAAERAASTQQLALREREAERAALKDKLKAAQAERKAHLERLKNQIDKRIRGCGMGKGNAGKNRKASKTVAWKDGLFSDKDRKRDVLEVVHTLPSHEPAEPPEESGNLKRQAEPPKSLVEEEGDPPPENAEDDDEDYDETLLL